MAAVALACTSVVLFGGATVAIRLGLRRSPEARLASLVMTAVALAVAGGAALVSVDEAPLDELWPFALAGVLAPGLSQILFVAAVAAAGPSRVSVVVGTAPLVAVVIAIVFLDEPVEAALVAGALLIVLGGVALVSERVRPEDFRALGALLAFGATVLFATRDNVVRWLAEDTTVAPLAGAVAALVAGALVLSAYQLAAGGIPGASAVRRSLASFAPAGFLFGSSYVALFEAYERGRVSVVSPLVATESLWGVLLAALLLRRSELVGRRLVLGAALVVAGGALIGATRA
ncbi:MAG: DMT family transporter [Actinomycetota bacterium]|nr:DMT family transporter [Actinomycetota bacterium]